MALVEQPRRRARSDSHRTFAEEVALLLSFVIVTVLGLTLATLLVLEFLQILPGGLSTILVTTLLAFGIVVGKAIIERAISIPSVYRGSTPVVRYHMR